MPKQYTEPFDMIGCDFGHKIGKIICPFRCRWICEISGILGIILRAVACWT